jgi:formate dehydrogenase subunit gamma
MKKGMIQATDTFERTVHWTLAISCIVLFITGLGMMFHSLNWIGDITGGLKSLKYFHNITGLIFGFSLIFTISMWWKEAGRFTFPEDLDWLKCAGGYLWHVDKVPEIGKYNPGQKAFFLAVAGFGPLMVITGIVMMFQFIPLDLVRWMYPVHVFGFLTLLLFFFVHVYLGTIGNPGSLQAMLHGWVTREWAKKQHPKWLREMEEHGKLIVYGEEKSPSHSGQH